jgi:hypothetical protein
MSEEDAESWLTREAQDLLDQGTVGLYEFIWGLRGTSFGLPDYEARRIAAGVAERLVASGKAQLYGVSWPAMEVQEGPLPISVLEDPSSWSEGDSGPLVALVPTADHG